MSNPIIPKTNATPGAGAPGSLLLGEVATNRSAGELYLGTDAGVELVGERVTSIVRGGTGSTSAAAALVALGAAPLVSPAFSGTPTVPTASVGTNTTQAASTAFVQANRGDKYLTTSSSTWTLANDPTATFTVAAGLSYTPTQDVTVVYDAANHAHGTVVTYSGTTLVVDIAQHTGTGTYSAWTINVGGLSAQEGALLQANNLNDVADAATALANIGGFSNTATLDILHGGTGATNQQAALNAISGGVTAQRVLAGDGTNVTLRQLTTADVPTLSQLGGFATTQILGLESGGTGASSQQAALNALAGAVTSGQVLAGNGSNVSLRALTTDDLPVVGIQRGGLGVTAAADILTNNALAPFGIVYVQGRQNAVIPGAVVNNVFTATSNGALTSGDGYSFAVGDLLLNVGTYAGSAAHLGPWIVTDLGSATTKVVLTRPTWFRGTIPASCFYFHVLNGATTQGQIHVIRVSTISGTTQSITVGTTLLSNLGSLVGQSGATMSGTFVFRGGISAAAPARFQTNTALQSAQIPHSIEWDNSRMYLTNISSQRLMVAYTSDIPALTTAAASALATSASAGISTQAARADHVHPLPLPAINSTALTSYTLALSDNNATVSTSSGSAVAVTIPLNSSVPFSTGTQVLLYQAGAGQITVAGAGGVTLRSSGGKTKTSAQYALATLLKIAADEWVLGGDITT